MNQKGPIKNRVSKVEKWLAAKLEGIRFTVILPGDPQPKHEADKVIVVRPGGDIYRG